MARTHFPSAPLLLGCPVSGEVQAHPPPSPLQPAHPTPCHIAPERKRLQISEAAETAEPLAGAKAGFQSELLLSWLRSEALRMSLEPLMPRGLRAPLGGRKMVQWTEPPSTHAPHHHPTQSLPNQCYPPRPDQRPLRLSLVPIRHTPPEATVCSGSPLSPPVNIPPS